MAASRLGGTSARRRRCCWSIACRSGCCWAFMGRGRSITRHRRRSVEQAGSVPGTASRRQPWRSRALSIGRAGVTSSDTRRSGLSRMIVIPSGRPIPEGPIQAGASRICKDPLVHGTGDALPGAAARRNCRDSFGRCAPDGTTFHFWIDRAGGHVCDARIHAMSTTGGSFPVPLPSAADRQAPESTRGFPKEVRHCRFQTAPATPGSGPFADRC